MIPRVHIQILDNTLNDSEWSARQFDDPAVNKFIADELNDELSSSYPSMVSVEYIDLFLYEDDEYFQDIAELLSQGILSSPLVLINGVVKIQGGIPAALIKQEVEALLFSGPVH